MKYLRTLDIFTDHMVIVTCSSVRYSKHHDMFVCDFFEREEVTFKHDIGPLDCIKASQVFELMKLRHPEISTKYVKNHKNYSNPVHHGNDDHSEWKFFNEMMG